MQVYKLHKPVYTVLMATNLEFRFNSGCLALDLAATLRYRPSSAVDVLAAPGAPERWLGEANLLERPHDMSASQLEALLSLREAIWTAASAVHDATRPPPAAVAVINAAAAHQPGAPQLDGVALVVRVANDDPVSAALATIARDAIGLLGTTQRRRIKACAQPDCQMLFIDASRSSRRRWCSMDRCGSRAKGSTFRSRYKRDVHED